MSDWFEEMFANVLMGAMGLMLVLVTVLLGVVTYKIVSGDWPDHAQCCNCAAVECE